MLRKSKGNVRKLISAIVVLCPHSMTVERVVSGHNVLMSTRRESTDLTNVKYCLLINLDGKGQPIMTRGQ